MEAPELATNVARGFTQRFGPSRGEPWRGTVRTSPAGFEQYGEKLSRCQRLQDPALALTTLLAEGMPVCPESGRADQAVAATRDLSTLDPEVRERFEGISTLLDGWLADDSGHDERVWPELKEALDRSRTSDRRLFGE